jgi:hypothetical protein
MGRLEETNLVLKIRQPRPKRQLHGTFSECGRSRQTNSRRKTNSGCLQDVPAIESIALKTDLVVHGILLFALAALSGSGILPFSIMARTGCRLPVAAV